MLIMNAKWTDREEKYSHWFYSPTDVVDALGQISISNMMHSSSLTFSRSRDHA